MTEPRPLKVFLCHASADKPAVRKLYRYLKQRGVSPWLDEMDLLPGENWEVEIPRALFESDVILACLSKNSVDKEGYVQKEITFALDKALEKPEGTIFVIPVKLEDCNVPQRLNRFQWVDLYREDGRKRLMLSLNKRAAQLGAAIRQASVSDDSTGRAEREAAEKAAREKAEREAAEKSAREKAEREAAEKAAREKAERETAEKAAREKTEREAAEKAAREKTEREAAEKAAREKAEREAAENAAREKAKREAAEKAKQKNIEPPVGQNEILSYIPRSPLPPGEGPGVRAKPARKINFRPYGIAGIVLIVLLCGIYGIIYAINNWPATVPPTPTSRPATKTATFTPKPPTTTITPIPPTYTRVPPTFTPTPGIGSTMLSEKDGMTLVFVPAGEFTMGSETRDDEKPVHKVILDSYWIDQTEVTNKMYALCVEARVCQPPSSTSSYTRKDYFGNSEFEDYPVIYVDWNKAKTYCEWAGRRLPTEAEWEKAARGTDGRKYPWGENIDCTLANYYDGSKYCVGDTSKVGSYLGGTSIYGALDMTGNVWEWVADWYDAYPGNTTGNSYFGTTYRVLRGGAWVNVNFNARSANRSWDLPSNTYDYIGFRCARSLP